MWWHDKESDWWARGTSLLHGLEFLTAWEIQGTVTRNSPCNSTRFFYHCPVWLKLLPLTLLIFCCVFLWVFFFVCIYGLVFMFNAYKFLTKDIRVFGCEILLKMLNSGHCKKKKKKEMIAILCRANMFSELWLKDTLRWNLYKRLIRSSQSRHIPTRGHLVLNPYRDLYIPSLLSSGTASCMYYTFKKVRLILSTGCVSVFFEVWKT